MKHHVSKSWLHSDPIVPRLVSLSQMLLQKEQAVEAGVRAKRQVKQRMEEQLRTVEVRLSLLAQGMPAMKAVSQACAPLSPCRNESVWRLALRFYSWNKCDIIRIASDN